MDNLSKILQSLPKEKLSHKADLKIRLKLYRLTALAYLKSIRIHIKQGSRVPSWRPNVLNKAFIAAMIFILVFSATSIFAYADDSIVPGDIMYPLKKAVEKIETSIAPSKPAKIAVYEKTSVRRLEEAVNMSKTAANINAAKITDSESQAKPEKDSKTAPKTEPKAKIEKISENINKNIDEVIDSHQAIAESINNIDDHKEGEKQAAKAKEADKAKADYLDSIAQYAISVNDEKTLNKVREAQDIINNQKYKYEDEKQSKKSGENKANGNIEKNNQDKGGQKTGAEDQNQDKTGENGKNHGSQGKGD